MISNDLYLVFHARIKFFDRAETFLQVLSKRCNTGWMPPSCGPLAPWMFTNGVLIRQHRFPCMSVKYYLLIIAKLCADLFYENLQLVTHSRVVKIKPNTIIGSLWQFRFRVAKDRQVAVGVNKIFSCHQIGTDGDRDDQLASLTLRDGLIVVAKIPCVAFWHTRFEAPARPDDSSVRKH